MLYNLIKYQACEEPKLLRYRDLDIIQPHFVFIVLAQDGIGEADALFGELIHVRRGYTGVGILTTHVTVAHVVGENKYDVWLCGHKVRNIHSLLYGAELPCRTPLLLVTSRLSLGLYPNPFFGSKRPGSELNIMPSSRIS